MFYWLTFKGYKSGTVQAKNEADARNKGKEISGVEVVTVDRLPYPAMPKLHEIDFPAFCYKPTTCRGNFSCPMRHACSD